MAEANPRDPILFGNPQGSPSPPDGTDLEVIVDRQEVLQGEAFLRKNGVGPRTWWSE